MANVIFCRTCRKSVALGVRLCGHCGSRSLVILGILTLVELLGGYTGLRQCVASTEVLSAVLVSNKSEHVNVAVPTNSVPEMDVFAGLDKPVSSQEEALRWETIEALRASGARAQVPPLTFVVSADEKAQDDIRKIKVLMDEGNDFEKAGELAKAIAKYREVQELKSDPQLASHIVDLRVLIVSKAKPLQTASSAIWNLTGVFRATFREEGKSVVLTMNLKQNGTRVTGLMTVTLPDGGPMPYRGSMSDPIKATIKGNRLVPDVEDGGSGGTKVISPDYNKLSLDTPNGTIVFKRIK